MDESIQVLAKILKRLRCHVHATASIFDFSIVNSGASAPVANLHKSRDITGSYPPEASSLKLQRIKKQVEINRVKSGNPLSWNF
jgi:hypothetical protein